MNRRRLSGSEVSIYLGSIILPAAVLRNFPIKQPVNEQTSLWWSYRKFVYFQVAFSLVSFFLSFSFLFFFISCSCLLCFSFLRERFCLFLPHSPFPPFILSLSIAFYISFLPSACGSYLRALSFCPIFFHTPTPASARSYACRAADPNERLTEVPRPFLYPAPQSGYLTLTEADRIVPLLIS